jgi:hypothetical protein
VLVISVILAAIAASCGSGAAKREPVGGSSTSVKTTLAVKPSKQVKKKATPAHKKVAPAVQSKPRPRPRPAPLPAHDPQGY